MSFNSVPALGLVALAGSLFVLGATLAPPAGLAQQGQRRSLAYEDEMRDFEVFDAQIEELFESRDIERIENYVSGVRESMELFKNERSHLSGFYWNFNQIFDRLPERSQKRFEDWIKSWVSQRPDSPTPLVLLAVISIKRAWKARGVGWSSEVEVESWAAVRENMRKARSYLETADSLDTFDPAVLQRLLQTELMLGGDRAYYEQIISRATKESPTYYEIFDNAAIRYLHRWGGRPGEVEAMADRVARETQEAEPELGDSMYAVIAYSVQRYVGYELLLSEYQFDWKRAKKSAEDLMRYRPESIDTLNRMTWLACAFGDKKTAAEWFARIENDQFRWVWGDGTAFTRWRNWANTPDVPASIDPLLAAIRSGRTRAVRRWIAAGKSAEGFNNMDQSALMVATSHGRLAIIDLLLDSGVDVDAQLPDGTTALHFAVNARNIVIVRKLIDHGAKLNLTNEYSKSPLLLAIDSDFLDAIQALIKAGVSLRRANEDGPHPLNRAVFLGRLRAARLLINAGAPIDTPESQFYPLYTAIHAGRTEVTKLLIDSGANLEARSQVGITPLLLAARLDNALIARMLLEAGADPNSLYEFNYNALHLTARRGNVEAAKILIEVGKLDPFAPSAIDKKTPRMIAVQFDHQHYVDFIDDLGELGYDSGPLIDVDY